MNWKPETPRVPNFIQVSLGRDQTMWPVSAFTEAELRDLGERWTEALVKRAETQAEEQRAAAEKAKSISP